MNYKLKVSNVSMMYEKKGWCNFLKKKKDTCGFALENISFELTNGFYGLLGPNGAGKSTLMNVVTGILCPTSGSVTFSEVDKICTGNEFRQRLGFMPQQQGLYDQFTGRQFLEYMCVLKNIARENRYAEIERTSALVNMTRVMHKKIQTYSGGMKQRILLASALLGTPGLLVLDEPTAGLDPKERAGLRHALAKLSKEAVVLMSTHVVSDLEDACDGILMLKDGKLVCAESKKSILQNYHADCLEDVYMKVYGEGADEIIFDRNA